MMTEGIHVSLSLFIQANTHQSTDTFQENCHCKSIPWKRLVIFMFLWLNMLTLPNLDALAYNYSECKKCSSKKECFVDFWSSVKGSLA